MNSSRYGTGAGNTLRIRTERVSSDKVVSGRSVKALSRCRFQSPGEWKLKRGMTSCWVSPPGGRRHTWCREQSPEDDISSSGVASVTGGVGWQVLTVSAVGRRRERQEGIGW